MSKKLRAMSVFTVVIILFSMLYIVAVSAENVYASIESAGISIEIPREFNVTAAEVNMDETIVYNLDAYMNDTSKKLSITAEKNNITENMYNFKYLTKEQLEGEIENIKAGTQTLTGKTFQSVSTAALKEMPEYILFTLSDSKIQNNITVHYSIAYTVINGELVTIQYSSASGNFNSEDIQIFNKICESVYVTALYEKPEKVSMPDIFKTVTTVIIVLAVIIAVILVGYYLISRNNAKSKEVLRNRRKLSEKYYRSLKNEGIMEDIKIEAEEFINENIANSGNTVIEPSENARPKNPEKISAIIEKASTNPTLIDDEWEDIDLTAMFQQPDTRSAQNPPTEFGAEMTFGNNEKVIPENIHRADSAKRYARLFIGEDKNSNYHDRPVSVPKEENPRMENDERMSDIKRRHRERQNKTHNCPGKKRSSQKRNKSIFAGLLSIGKNTKKGKNTKRRNTPITDKKRSSQNHRTTHSNTRPKKRQQNDTFAEYELDSYWNTYQNDEKRN